jgi:hypothetical protein
MSVFLSPIGGAGWQFFNDVGNVLAGGLLYTYLAGTTTPAATYTTSSGSVANSNPIVLNAEGRTPQEVWLTGGTQYKFIVHDATDVTVTPGTWDNISGINDIGTSSSSEWQSFTNSPTYISGTSFSVAGNQTAILTVGRRIKATVTAGTVYGTIVSSSFGTVTTVTLAMDGNEVLDSGLSAIFYSLLDPTNPSVNAVGVIYNQLSSHAINRTVEQKLQETLSVTDFGIVGDGATDNTTALANLVTYVNGLTTKPTVHFPAGTYVYTVSPNFGIQNSHWQADGEVYLQYTGTGNAVILDGSALPNLGCYDMSFKGFTINAPTTALNGAFINYVHHSDIELKCRGAGSTSAGIETSFCVCTRFHLEVSPNATNGWYLNATPLYGVFVNGPTSVLQTSYSVFTDTICEGLVTTNGAGIFLNAALGNSFYGGTSEASATGILTATAANGCVSNKFFGIDMEANVTQDIYDQGFQNEYHSCDTNKLVNVIGNTNRFQMFGGQHQNISVASGASAPGFFGVIYNRNGSGTFAIGDNSIRVRDCFDHTNNVPGPFTQTSVSAGASPWAFTNTYGRDIEIAISVSAGSVTQTEITRGGVGTLLASTVGLYPLSPQDVLTITYTGTLAAYLWTK